MAKMSDLDVWALAAKVNRMDIEIGAIWNMLRDKPRIHDERQQSLFGKKVDDSVQPADGTGHKISTGDTGRFPRT